MINKKNVEESLFWIMFGVCLSIVFFLVFKIFFYSEIIHEEVLTVEKISVGDVSGFLTPPVSNINYFFQKWLMQSLKLIVF